MFKSQHTRNGAIQALFVGGLLAVLIAVSVMTKHNLDMRGMSSGFGFLWRSTGWDIGFSFLPYSIRDPYWWALFLGLLNTLFIGYVSIVLASLLGVLVATMRMGANIVLRVLGTVFVDTVRNVPPILQVFIWYALVVSLPSPRQAINVAGMLFSARGVFLPGLNVAQGALIAAVFVSLAAIPFVIWNAIAPSRRSIASAVKTRISLMTVGLAGAVIFTLLTVSRLPDTSLLNRPEIRGLNIVGGVQIPPELSAMILAMTVYGAAYIAEVVRAGFLAVPKGQTEAARALGMSPWQIVAHIQAPLALRNMLPGLTNQYVWLLKASTLGVAIGFADFFLIVSASITQTGQTLELIAILIVAFWILNHSLAWALGRANEAMKLQV